MSHIKRKSSWSLIAFILAQLARPMAGGAAEPSLLAPSGKYLPANVYFGSYRNNEPLVEHPEQWLFVRQHADGMLLHFGYWLNNDYKADPVGTAKRLAPILREHGLKTLMEIGFPKRTEPPEAVDDMGGAYGREFSRKIADFEANAGLHVDEVECELRLFIFRQVADRHPEWSVEQIVEWITGVRSSTTAPAIGDGCIPQFLAAMRNQLGDRPIDFGCPPVYVPWKGLFTAGTDMRVTRAADLIDGKPRPGAPRLDFDGPTFFGEALGPGVNGFVCDSPWYLMGNKSFVEQGYLKKIVDVGRFMQARGKHFQFIVNASPKKGLPPTEWDKQYADQSMQSLITFQLAGGRADRYVLESWYDGPYTVVPDTEANTFTHLVRRAIVFLKGPGQTLQLTVDGKGTVTLTNTGDAACLPALRVRPAGPVTVHADGADVTAVASTPEGYTSPKLVPSGGTIQMHVSGRAAVEAVWNPQDPETHPRASVQVGGQ